jgi:type I restriction enzyme S subunit
MRNGWIRTQVSAVAAVQSGAGFPDRYQGQGDLEIPFYKVSDMNLAGNEREMIYENNSITEEVRRDLGAFLFPKGSTIFPKIGGAIATNKKRLTTRDCCVDNNVMGVIPIPGKIESSFLFYFFLSHDLSEFANEAHLPSIKKTVVEGWPISLPARLPEQQRIASILDEAFDGIATAKANAEKNLRNARALFEGYLQSLFAKGGTGWIHTTIGDQLTLQRGFDITKAQQNRGKVPVVSSGGIKSFHDVAMVEAPGVVIGRKGTLGKVFYLEDDFWPHDTTLWVKDFKGNIPRFIYYFFTALDVKKFDSGTANPALNRNQVHPIEVHWPPVEQQKSIVLTLEALRDQVQRLESIYQRKRAALDALKTSLLHRAFSGEL